MKGIKYDSGLHSPLRIVELDMHRNRLEKIKKRKHFYGAQKIKELPKRNIISESKYLLIFLLILPFKNKDERYRINEGNVSIVKNIIEISSRRIKVLQFKF